VLPFVLMAPEWVWTYWYITKLWSRRPHHERFLLVVTLTIYIGVQVGMLVSPWRWQFLLVWLIPQQLGMLVLASAFAHLQHPAESNWQDAPFQTTVRVRGTVLGKLYWLGQTDHCVHHALPHIPFQRYHRLWDLSDSALKSAGIPERGLFRGPDTIEIPRS